MKTDEISEIVNGMLTNYAAAQDQVRALTGDIDIILNSGVTLSEENKNLLIQKKAKLEDAVMDMGVVIGKVAGAKRDSYLKSQLSKEEKQEYNKDNRTIAHENNVAMGITSKNVFAVKHKERLEKKIASLQTKQGRILTRQMKIVKKEHQDALKAFNALVKQTKRIVKGQASNANKFQDNKEKADDLNEALNQINKAQNASVLSDNDDYDKTAGKAKTKLERLQKKSGKIEGKMAKHFNKAIDPTVVQKLKGRAKAWFKGIKAGFETFIAEQAASYEADKQQTRAHNLS